ncbi:MAG: YceI family protein [Daejeonella sp.]
MLKPLLFIFIMLVTSGKEHVKPLFITRNAQIGLFSTAPVEDIEAVSKNGYGIINLDNGELQFGVSIRSFQFRKSLMQEHFNENYMESDKYPAAKFKGKINTPIDISKDGVYQVTAIGDLEVHGVIKKRSLSGTVRVLNGKLEITSAFDVKCQDHNIKIPALVFKNIAETIQITLKGTFNSAT